MSYFDLHHEETIQAIENSSNLVEVLNYLNVNNNGGNKKSLKNFIEKYCINTEHFSKKLTKESYELNPKICKCCGKPIPLDKRQNSFCNSSCAAAFNNKSKSEKLTLTKQSKYCLNCGKELNQGSSSTHKFCDNKCQSNYHQNQWIERWKNGEETGIRGAYGISSHLKRYLMEKYQCKCSKCGWGEENPYSHTIPLEVEHIDGNFQNNNEDNLTLLCPNCHSLTSTYKGANKGNGRKGRKKYI